ncbi:MAG: tRNA lysidine(34) synthetase TilS [Clostridia bacterium]|nr:tRNA lysidine(34) synthetase TilS [Clostridia bacterium]
MLLWTDQTWRSCGVSASDGVLVALSGGADSVALLLELLRLQRNGLVSRVEAAHLHHGIRGSFADADAEFVRALCKRLAIPLISERIDVPERAKETGESLELAARNARHAFLERVRKDRSLEAVALGHHRDDQAETVLLRIIRGTGTDGLSGMRLRSGYLVRPLLYTGKDAILSYLKERGQDFCVDATNFEPDATRNKIRLELMPLLRMMNPSISETLSDMATHISEDADLLNRIADDLFRESGPYRMDRNHLQTMERPIRIRVLKRMLPYSDYTHTDLDRLDALLSGQTGDTVTLKNGVVAWLDSQSLRIGRNDPKSFLVYAPKTGSVRLPGGTLTVESVSKAVVPCGGFDAYVDAGRLSGTVFLRPPVNGDRFTPFGMHGRRLLSDYLTDRKVPRFERDIPILCDEIGVVWVVGHTVDERMRVTADSKHILHYHYEED